MNITKLELCTRVAKHFNPGQLPEINDYKVIFEAFLEEIMEAMANGSRIEIRGFGCFKPNIKKKRVGRNPRTGDVYDIPEYLAPYFRFSKEAQKIFDEKVTTLQEKPKTEKKPLKLQASA
jgi:integration host factor subunit beta